MTIFRFSLAIAAAAQPSWGDWSKVRQPPDGRWDATLLAADGEKRLRTFVRAQPSRRALEAQLARAHFMTIRGTDRCVLWSRRAMRRPLAGGVSAMVKICSDTSPQVRFFALPPF